MTHAAQTDPPPVVFITGASAGFGAAIARRFAGLGARLILAARRYERLEALAAELSGGGAGSPAGGRARAAAIHLVRLDVRDRGAVDRAVAELPPELSDVSVLVNNAGGAIGLSPAHEADPDDWEQMVDTNVKGLLHCTRAILPGMVARDRGHIINIGSVAAETPYPGSNVYGACKAFVAQLSLNLRADLLGSRVRVTDIEPGLAETEFSLVRFKGDRDRAAAVYEGVKPLSAEDVAEAVVWCATLPEHVNVNRLELMPVMQAFAGFAVKRD
ncbi:oxidoreductase [Sorangium cellulosum]|uniref:Oxidoreductase n=1 Tax=Sorangium cellulosum TaxID=56 RepID=A0A4P2Q1N0_SORCE|nr:SDR family oxidoreductase [Sorangium cellulosum]AUX23134.1 oxidoreductase [Sorangium cellulosum]